MFPQRLKSLRLEKKLTQQNMADFLGITRQGYAKYEKGMSEPDNKTLDKLANYFNVSTDFLLGRTNKKELNENVIVAGQKVTLSPEELQLFEELKKHPVLFHDLTSDPENKIKELIKLYKMKKILLEEENVEYGEGFGELED